MARATLAVIIGNRDFFPDRLVSEARADILALCQSLDSVAALVPSFKVALSVNGVLPKGSFNKTDGLNPGLPIYIADCF